MCPKGMTIVELVNSPYRITEPMRRKPDGQWERITYKQAADMVTERMRAVLERHGEKAGDHVALTMPLWDCRKSEIAALMALRTVGSVHAMPPGESCVSSASKIAIAAWIRSMPRFFLLLTMHICCWRRAFYAPLLPGRPH